MNLRIEKKYAGFTFLYFFTLLILLLDQLDNIPFTEQLRKIKYAYLFILFAWYVLSVKNSAAKDRISRKSNIVMLLCVAHTFLFGFVFTNDIVASYTYVHAREMLIYFALVYLTLTYIYENKLLLLFAQTTYIALVSQLVIALVTHPGDFVNPLTYWRVLSNSLRYRTDFGFVQFGYTANYCVFAIVASLLIFDIWRDNKQLKERVLPLSVIAVFDILILCMLCSTAGRSGILTVVLMIGIYALRIFLSRLSSDKRKFAKAIITLCVICVVVFVITTGFLASVWEDSNRELNISVNYPVFQQIGNIWTGMGFVENSEFQVGNHNNWTSIFGMRTSSLDIYYLYLYFTTGIIGCVLIGVVLLYLFIKFARGINKPYGLFGFTLISGWLFYAYWQCNMLTYRYYSPWFYLVVMLYILDNFKSNNELETMNENRDKNN